MARELSLLWTAGVPPAGATFCGSGACRRDAGAPKTKRFHSAWPLAERYEACLRVFNDPAPYARRLAARLHATPHRAREALRAPPDYEHRIDRNEDFESAVNDARRCFNSS